MTLGLPAKFFRDLLKAATCHAIIGLDFLEHFQILLNPHGQLMTLPEKHEKASTPGMTCAKLTENEAIGELHRPIPTTQTASSWKTYFHSTHQFLRWATSIASPDTKHLITFEQQAHQFAPKFAA